MRVLVGYDGSDGADDAVELARVLSGEDGDEVLMVRVLPNPTSLPVAGNQLMELADATFDEFFDSARTALGGITVRALTYGWTSPQHVLTDLAEAEDIDSIVVGSPHRGAIGRALIGSVAEGVLHGASCPVVVAPRGYAQHPHEPFRRIAIAYDGTSESKAALNRAEDLALETNGTLEVMTVLGLPVMAPGVVAYTPPVPIDAEGLLAEGVRSVARSLDVHDHLLSGPVAGTLAQRCSEVGADLLVVGSHRYGPVARVFLGSVSDELVHLSPCPVLVVPRAAGVEQKVGKKHSS